ncbi:hypothetical protein [Capybara microvirus Cap3_SP_550]|nr:hypothetical protein [Capybara microvirus Cap3_SP_550]
MIKYIYTIYDKVAQQATGNLMITDKEAALLRELKTANLGELVEKNLDDFDLYCIGELNTEIPQAIAYETAKMVIHLEVLKHGSKDN